MLLQNPIHCFSSIYHNLQLTINTVLRNKPDQRIIISNPSYQQFLKSELWKLFCRTIFNQIEFSIGDRKYFINQS